MSTALVWMCRDLRLTDHPALDAACRAHDRVLPVYIHAPDELKPWSPGAASRWWLQGSLKALDASLRQCGGRLHLCRGDSLQGLRQLAHASDAEAVYWNRLYEPAVIQRDTCIKQALTADGLTVESHPGNLWCEPWRIETQQGKPYRVFTPFWRQLRTRIDTETPIAPASPSQWATAQGSLPLEALDLLPAIDWTQGLADAWQPGEAGAMEMLELFADDALNHYALGRDLPARHGTSRLSPHLHFGEITPRQIHAFLHRRAAMPTRGRCPDPEPWLRELGWREFAHHLLYHFPHTPTENFNPRFDHFQWAADDAAALQRWQQGRTGIPLVDAGMRELWHTGWMHNRVRMVVASYLTKNLRQHWLHGARWFWDTLVDADLANNSLGWQWVAGSGADAAPYFRVFNPYTQAKKFDPDGTYLRRWLPELEGLPLTLLHDPDRDRQALIDRGYPWPLADPKTSRKEALAAWEQVRDH